MGPVPNPVPVTGLSDQDMPQPPPIVLSSSDDDEEQPSNDYPPGYMPITHYMEVQVKIRQINSCCILEILY